MILDSRKGTTNKRLLTHTDYARTVRLEVLRGRKRQGFDKEESARRGCWWYPVGRYTVPRCCTCSSDARSTHDNYPIHLADHSPYYHIPGKSFRWLCFGS